MKATPMFVLLVLTACGSRKAPPAAQAPLPAPAPAPAAAIAADAGAAVEPPPSPSPQPGGGGGLGGSVLTHPPVGGRTRLLAPGSPEYGRLEGASFLNSCKGDGERQISGCSGEVCAAESVVLTCVVLDTPAFPAGERGCGCVAGECVWYRSAP